MAMGACEVAHVVDAAKHFDVDLREHLEGLARILEADVAGRRNDHCAGEGHGLNERDDHIAGAGWKIDDEVVELAPLNLLKELTDDLVEHGPTHDEGLVAGRNVAD